MKKIFFLFLLLIVFLPLAIQKGTSPSYALSPSPSQPSPTQNESLLNQINNLKERIASKVAQLKLVEKRGILGTVTDSTSTTITINDVYGQTRLIDVDDITKFSSPSAKSSFGISDITKGTKISAIGLYNKQSKRITARFIEATTWPLFINGVVTAINRKDFYFKTATEDNKELTIDVENITKTQSADKNADLTSSGFSKMQPGERVIVVAYPTKTQQRFIASRILTFTDLPRNMRITAPIQALPNTENITPSTGNGKKLTPITR